MKQFKVLLSPRVIVGAAIFAILLGCSSTRGGEIVEKEIKAPSPIGLDYYSQGGIVQNGIAYFTADDHSRRQGMTIKQSPDFPCVVAFDVNTFKTVRVYPFAKTYDSTPMVILNAKGEWIILAHEHEKCRTVAMHRDTGKVLWIGEDNQPGMMFFGYSFYQLPNGTKLILMACQNGLHAMSLQTGHDVWWAKHRSVGGITPCVGQQNGHVFFQATGKLLKFRAADGAVLAETDVAKPNRGVSGNTVLIDDEHGYFIATRWYGRPEWDSAIRVYDNNLKLIWQKTKIPSGKKDTLTYAKGKIVTGCGNMWSKNYSGNDWKYITAYDIRTGTVAWKCDLRKYEFTSIINVPFFNGHFYAETQDSTGMKSKLFRIDASDGRLLEVYEYGRAITSCAPSIIANGMMLSGDLHSDRIVVTRLADNSKVDWLGPFGDPQTHHNAVVDPNAQRVSMHEITK